MEDFALHTMLAEIWRVVGDANRYFASEEPWVKRKTDPERFATVLYVTAEVLRAVAIMVPARDAARRRQAARPAWRRAGPRATLRRMWGRRHRIAAGQRAARALARSSRAMWNLSKTAASS